MSENIYICAVKHKKAFSLYLISLTLLTSMQFVSYFDFGANVHPGPCETRLIADSQEASHEFRESHELGVSDEIRPEAAHGYYQHATFDFGILSTRQYDSFQRQYLLYCPTKRRFIANGALIL
jgi:hypothetical protein